MHLRTLLLLLWAFVPTLQACQGPHQPTQSETQGPQADSIARFKLIFAGDIMGHSPQITAALDGATNTYNYEPCFRYVKPILEKADMAIGNLELTLPGKGPYTGYPMFRSPDAIAGALKNAGFDFLVTANNHSNDGGLKGVTHTIDVIQGLGMEQTGTFKDAEERKKRYPLVIKQPLPNGRFIKLAFVNYTYDTNGIPDHKPSIVNLINREQMAKDIALAKSYSPDMIIAVMHWGLEYQLNESPEQQGHTKFLWEQGVDLVIGAHPHVVQPVKTDEVLGPDGRKRPVLCVYSLGNFISNQQQPNTDMGLLFEVELEKNLRTGRTSIGKHNYIPIWRYIGTEPGSTKKQYFALPAAEFEDNQHPTLKLSAADLAKLKAVLERVRKHMGKFASSEKKL